MGHEAASYANNLHHPLKYILLAGALGIDMVSLLHGQRPMKQAVACGRKLTFDFTRAFLR